MRKDFQWIIMKKDEYPILSEEGLNKFFNKSFDPDLGWIRRPNSQGIEKGKFGDVKYNIDWLGSRENKFSEKYDSTIACYGDSYAFCRQVHDFETWEHYLSDILKSSVLNFGVGNYGLDQAFLRYQKSHLPESVNTVIIAVVPETICRIQSTWKHYLEFGNTFAFKPRFFLDNSNNLNLITNPMQKREDFDNYKSKLDEIIKHDRFYYEKFRKNQFRFPFSISFLRNIKRNIFLTSKLLQKNFFRLLNISKPHIEDAPFEFIMNENIKMSHKMYQDKKSVELLKSIINTFFKLAEKRKHKAYVVILPQLIDLRILGNKTLKTYSNVLSNLEIGKGTLYDMTDEFKKVDDIEKFYINDKYGGHISNVGNKFIAQKLAKMITQK